MKHPRLIGLLLSGLLIALFISACGSVNNGSLSEPMSVTIAKSFCTALVQQDYTMANSYSAKDNFTYDHGIEGALYERITGKFPDANSDFHPGEKYLKNCVVSGDPSVQSAGGAADIQIPIVWTLANGSLANGSITDVNSNGNLLVADFTI